MSNGKSGLSVSKRREELRKKKEKQRQQRLMAVGVLAAIVIVAAVIFFLTQSNQAVEPGISESGERPLADISPTDRNDYYSQYPPMVIDTTNSYDAVISVQGKGDIRLTLFDDEAPLTVNNFVYLANAGFYDGLKFHRVMADFMAQGGDPTGLGIGGPGYEFEDETGNGRTFDKRGLLAMANGGPNTNGSQFFITFVPTPHLNGAHTIFGELIEGDDVLSSLTIDPTEQTADIIERIVIIEE
jgi:cyclophilin family peptidyl-prolyl cis-trans isomerase